MDSFKTGLKGFLQKAGKTCDLCGRKTRRPLFLKLVGGHTYVLCRRCGKRIRKGARKRGGEHGQ